MDISFFSSASTRIMLTQFCFFGNEGNPAFERCSVNHGTSQKLKYGIIRVEVNLEGGSNGPKRTRVRMR